jgi:hypothetical protein
MLSRKNYDIEPRKYVGQVKEIREACNLHLLNLINSKIKLQNVGWSNIASTIKIRKGLGG